MVLGRSWIINWSLGGLSDGDGSIATASSNLYGISLSNLYTQEMEHAGECENEGGLYQQLLLRPERPSRSLATDDRHYFLAKPLLGSSCT